MSESEFIEAINMHASNGIGSFSIYITFTFAYLTASYLVGARLSRFQAFAVSSLYVLASVGFCLATITHTQSFGALVRAYPQFVNSFGWGLPWSALAGVIQVGGIIISLIFLFDIRAKSSA